MKLLTCSFCEYKTNRAYNLKRHQNSKHIEDMINPELVQNVPSGLKCKFCNKKYETERHLLNHEKKCNKVDSLTCPRCMISFTNRKHKSRHIKANKC